MYMNKKETWIQVPKSSKFVNIGVDFEGEINFFKIVFMIYMKLELL